MALGDGARIEARGGTLRIGAGTASASARRSPAPCTVGRECVVGDWARAEGDARLEDRARLAAHAVALSGARVGAGGVVVPSYAVIAPEPAGHDAVVSDRAPRSSS